MVAVKNLKPFTLETIKDRDLIIRMLRFENDVYKGEKGQTAFREMTPHTMEPIHYIHRETLLEHGFRTDDESVKNYREIFRNYYQGPEDFDKEVIDSVLYMKYNRCIYYTEPKIEVGDTLPNCRLYELDGKTKTSVHGAIIPENRFNLVCSFSQS